MFRIVLCRKLVPCCNLDHANLKILMSLCYLCKCYVILGYVNVSLVQHLIVLSEIFVENTFNF